MLDLFPIKPNTKKHKNHHVTIMGLLTPSSSINYNFVAGVYGAFAVLSIVLFILQRFTTAVEGFYMVVTPFVPCFFWSLLVRQRWLQDKAKDASDTTGASTTATTTTATETTVETKKDQ